MKSLIDKSALLFDTLEDYWESRANMKRIGVILILFYIGALLVIQINIWGWFPEKLAGHITTNRFNSIGVAFTLLLVVEVISLVFALAKSVSTSLIKQFEILSLILLRQSFKEFGHFHGTIEWVDITHPIYHVLSDAFGALLIFVAIIIISKLKHQCPITNNRDDQKRFINLKKLLALLLLSLFIILGFYDLFMYLFEGELSHFFETFYTILIFNDILLVLISLRYSYSYLIVFRNSGFALATVILRLALSGPPYINVILGFSAALFVMGLIYIYTKYGTEQLRE